MSPIYPSRLAAKVAARNKVHQTAMEQIPAMIAALAPFVGKKVQNATGCLAEKVKKALPPRPAACDGYLTPDWWYSASKYAISVQFKVCCHSQERYGQGGNYAECSATIGIFGADNGILTNTNNGQQFRTDFTEAEILAARKLVQERRSALQDAESKLCHFGEYDN